MSLGKLICGENGTECVANSSLNHLSTSIDSFADRAVSFLDPEANQNVQYYGSLCARVILENSFAALVGRLDPFRLSYLAEFQSQATFEYGRAAKSGFRWSQDVMSEDKPPPDLWHTDNDIAKVSRALFSSHSSHLHWRPAFEKALDHISEIDNPFLNEIKSIEPNGFIPKYRGACAALYSRLSKGVHWDFFISSVALDADTIRDAIRETLMIASLFGLVSHFISTSYRAVPAEIATTLYTNFRETFP